MNLLFENTVPLSSAVKAAALDCGEDYTKVEATFNHWAVRILKDVNRKLLRLGYFRGTLPVHANYKTVALPLGISRVTAVGIVDECGVKHLFSKNTNMVGHVEEVICLDKCKECGQGKDICENLSITEENTIVSITDSTGTNNYTNTTSKIFENGGYYLIKKQWVKNIPLNLAQEITTKEFIVEFDMLKCGCIAPIESNIEKIKDTCFDCYSTCYSACKPDGIGSYRVIDNLIQLDTHTHYTKVYVEGETILCKKNGVYEIPEVAFETIVAGIKHRRSWNKKSMSATEKTMDKNDFTEKYDDCRTIIGRMSIGDILDSFDKIPKVTQGK